MYLGFVLGDIEAHDIDKSPLDLDHLPDTLRGYYEQFWSHMEQTRETAGWADWKTLYRATIERLAVAAEPVNADWIRAQFDRDRDEVRERVLLPWARLLSARSWAGACVRT